MAAKSAAMVERTTESKRIVVGVDASEDAREALRWATAEARLRGATLHVVHAWTHPLVGQTIAFGTAYADEGVLQEAAEQLVTNVVAEAVGDAPDLEVERSVIESPAALALTEAARGADLLVVGSRGHGGFTGLLLGSVSQQCATHAPCPVTIVPLPRRG